MSLGSRNIYVFRKACKNLNAHSEKFGKLGLTTGIQLGSLKVNTVYKDLRNYGQFKEAITEFLWGPQVQAR
jgi:hypothetical protein